jgi:cation diffusion facilitator CzcD-associated flavoprotein CzcO
VSVSFLYSRLLSRAVTGISKWHMRRQVPDAGLFEKVWPQYPVGCKRILFSSNYLPALTRPNVDVVTDGIAEITPRGVRTADGVLHEVDVIVYGTGFTASDFLAPMKILGRGRRNLREQWADGARAYLGISVPHFPNLYIMYGPNTNVGSGSIVFMLEQQARFIVDALAHAKRWGAPIEVKPEVEEAFDTEIQGRLASSVWTKCSSWYRNAAGRVSTNWPGTSLEYRKRTKFSPNDYQIVK